MELIQLTNRVYYYPQKKEVDRPLLGYIRGDKYSLMIDAGTSRNHVQEFYKAVSEKGLTKPHITAITHWHWDHTFGMNAIEGITIANIITNNKLEEMKSWKWTDEAIKERITQGIDIEFGDIHMRREYKNLENIQVVTADLVFNQKLSLDLGGITAELFLVESPHSNDAVFVYIREEKVVFMGDSTSEDFYNDNFLDKNKLKSLVSTLESIECDYCLLGHAEPLKKQDLLDYLYTLY